MNRSPTEIFSGGPAPRRSWMEAYTWVYMMTTAPRIGTPHNTGKIIKEYQALMDILGKTHTDHIFEYAIRRGIIDDKIILSPDNEEDSHSGDN